MALIAFTGAGQAATVDFYTLEAESTSSSYSNFYLTFEDTDGDSILGAGDTIRTFGGISQFSSGLLGSTVANFDTFVSLNWTLELTNYLIDSAGYAIWDVAGGTWQFQRDTLLGMPSLFADATQFNYKLLRHGAVNPVPLPATAFLLLAAVVGLAVMRRVKV